MADQYRYNKQDLAEIFRRTKRTIDKWRKIGLIPEPNRILREPYWTAEQLEQAWANLNGRIGKSAE